MLNPTPTPTSSAPFRMPDAWHGQVPPAFLGHHRRQFEAFDTFMVVNKTTKVAVQSASCAGLASMAATAMSDHNHQHGHPDRYGVVPIPAYLSGKTAPENWQTLLDNHN